MPAKSKSRRRKSRPLLVAAAGASLLVLPGITSCGQDATVGPDKPDLTVRAPDGNLPFNTQDLSQPDLTMRQPDGNLPFPIDLSAPPDMAVPPPDLSARQPDGNLPFLTPDLTLLPDRGGRD